ncbi:MAG: hypothetical protein V5A55_00915 [Halovenus sp.]
MSGQTATPIEPPRALEDLLRTIAFLGVVLLPLASIPVLYATSGRDRFLILGGIVLTNVCCLIIDQLT